MLVVLVTLHFEILLNSDTYAICKVFKIFEAYTQLINDENANARKKIRKIKKIDRITNFFLKYITKTPI